MDNNQLNLIEMIDYIEPSGLDYQEWCAVGMALQHEGYPVSVWENWSRRDPDRYHAGECERKWRKIQWLEKDATCDGRDHRPDGKGAWLGTRKGAGAGLG